MSKHTAVMSSAHSSYCKSLGRVVTNLCSRSIFIQVEFGVPGHLSGPGRPTNPFSEFAYMGFCLFFEHSWMILPAAADDQVLGTLSPSAPVPAPWGEAVSTPCSTLSPDLLKKQKGHFCVCWL